LVGNDNELIVWLECDFLDMWIWYNVWKQVAGAEKSCVVGDTIDLVVLNKERKKLNIVARVNCCSK